ncbi:hypothetical protein FPZ54_02295 [Sphingomonas suaedae]|uniref:Uncharacterized protein n=2 Tax=Sphingomonas suaedae TaxID=2599297 RepID=A0A518RBZ2_9SPHN|nr:hypothetical protein FPZ54_02295 [Sphingomonas suaedae]
MTSLVHLPIGIQNEGDAPRLGGPFYTIGNEQIGTPDETVIFAATGTRSRSGATATMTILIFRKHPKMIGPVELGRFDSIVEYHCQSRASRTRQIAIRDGNNRLMRILPPETGGFDPLKARDPVTPVAAGIACGLQRPSGPPMLTITDVERAMRGYRAS